MLRIAIPLALAELGWMFMGVVDTIMVGRLPDSAVSIGAASVGNALFYSFAIFGIGLMSGLDTLGRVRPRVSGVRHAGSCRLYPQRRTAAQGHRGYGSGRETGDLFFACA